jgi:hypothetical protein
MIQDLERCKQDGDYFRAQLGTDRGFLITYNLLTEESVEAGDTEDGGFDGFESCEPDEFDDAPEGATNDLEAASMNAVHKAVTFLTREHCVEPSGSHFYPGTWYSDADGDTDYRTGEETRHAYHPTNFTIDEQRAIFNAVNQ